MEASYRRNFNQSYMILEGEGATEENCELSVLAYNRIPGLLPMETEIADGEIRFWYDITGRQTLRDYLERRQVDEGLLHLLFRSLEGLCSELAEYFLKESHVVLSPEYLYLDFSGETLEFVYLPGWEQDIRDAFQEMMEGLLRRLNHGDKRASDIAYGMYQLSLQREMSFYAMMQQALQTGQSKQEEDHAPEVYEGFGEDGSWRKETVSEEGSTDSQENTEKTGMGMREKSVVPENPFERLKNNILGKYRPDKNQEPEELPYVTQEEETVVYPTELLCVKGEIQGILMYQGAGNQPEIRIDRPVFLLGKKADEVDGHIEEKSVSRVHARIERDGEDYYLEDMNSTNGTFLNGEQLEYRQKVKLAAGDRLGFGNTAYVFR